jgi:hypothetical protein
MMGHNHIIGRAEIYLSLVGLAAAGSKCDHRTAKVSAANHCKLLAKAAYWLLLWK